MEYRIYVGPNYEEITTASPNFVMKGHTFGSFAGGKWERITSGYFGRYGGGNETSLWVWKHGDEYIELFEGMDSDLVFKMNGVEVFPLPDDAGGEFVKITYGVGGGEDYLMWRFNPPKPQKKS